MTVDDESMSIKDSAWIKMRLAIRVLKEKATSKQRVEAAGYLRFARQWYFLGDFVGAKIATENALTAPLKIRLWQLERRFLAS